jgi:hypothetical protein
MEHAKASGSSEQIGNPHRLNGFDRWLQLEGPDIDSRIAVARK